MSTKKEKKKKSVLKRILQITGITLVLIILAAVLLPIIFKDEIKEIAVKEANKMLKADVAVGDFDLTMITSFPKLKLSFEDVSVTGRDAFEGVKLVDMKSFEAKLDFWSVINMENISVRSIHLIEPNIHVKVLEDGQANYDIMKSDEEMLQEEEEETESGEFNFSLEYYEIVDANVIYDDRLGDMYAEIVNLNHSGSGDMTAASFDFDTDTHIDELTYKMDGVPYMSKVETDLDMEILVEMQDDNYKFTLKENELALNALKLSFDGFYEMKADHSNMDLTLLANNTSFKDLLSLIPAFYHTGYEDMIADGSVGLNAVVKGRLDDTNYPAWDMAMKVQNASIAYPDMPANINNILINADSKFDGGSNLDAMTVNVDQFKAQFVGNTIDANLFMKNPMSDPYLKSKIHLDVDLSTISQVYPMDEEEELVGTLKSDIALEGRMSTIEKEEYEDFNASGKMTLKGFNYSLEDLPAPVEIENLVFEFTPQQLKLGELKATMGKSDFALNGNIQNYLGYAFSDEALKGEFTYHSKVLDIDELMPESPESTSTAEGSAESEETASDSNAEGSEDAEAILIPKTLDFVLNSKVDKILYDGIEINNLQGKVIIKNEEAVLEDLTMQTLGGDVGLNGKYNTQNKQVPKIEFAYSLKDLEIQALSEHFLTIDKLAPVAQYTTGKISSDFTMNSSLKPSFEPIFNTLEGDGSLLSDNITISGFEPLEKLANAINLPRLKKQTLDNINATFEFSEGKVRVKPFDVKLGGIVTNIEGTTSFLQEIDYKLQMNIPKEDIPSEILKVAEQAIAKAQNIPGFNMKELPANIPITALITNTIKDPKVKTNLKEKILELGGDIKGGVKDFVDDKVQEAKDSIQNVVDDKVDEAKEKLEEKKQELLEKAQEQADKIKADAKKLADKTREEADENAQKLIDDAGSNPLKKKGAEIAAKKLREKGEKAAQEIENEAETRADNLMEKARERANNLGK